MSNYDLSKRKSLKYGLLLSLSILSYAMISHASSVVIYLRILWEDLWLTLFQSFWFEWFSFLMINIFLSNINLNFKFSPLLVLLFYLSSPEFKVLVVLILGQLEFNSLFFRTLLSITISWFGLVYEQFYQENIIKGLRQAVWTK